MVWGGGMSGGTNGRGSTGKRATAPKDRRPTPPVMLRLDHLARPVRPGLAGPAPAPALTRRTELNLPRLRVLGPARLAEGLRLVLFVDVPVVRAALGTVVALRLARLGGERVVGRMV